MLFTFKECKPLDFLRKPGYKADLLVSGCGSPYSLVMLDESNEAFMDIMLTAHMELIAEGKTISAIRYTGKGARRWFKMVFPPVLSPVFFGILDNEARLSGYLVVTQSSSVSTRKGLGIALVNSCRRLGIGYKVFKHVQDHLDELFQPRITELLLETSRDNEPMLKIARRLGFKETPLPKDDTWGKQPVDRIRFLWTRPQQENTS